jgi:hypothetical protein
MWDFHYKLTENSNFRPNWSITRPILHKVIIRLFHIEYIACHCSKFGEIQYCSISRRDEAAWTHLSFTEGSRPPATSRFIKKRRAPSQPRKHRTILEMLRIYNSGRQPDVGHFWLCLREWQWLVWMCVKVNVDYSIWWITIGVRCKEKIEQRLCNEIGWKNIS